jgi:hypothetical protein
MVIALKARTGSVTRAEVEERKTTIGFARVMTAIRGVINLRASVLRIPTEAANPSPTPPTQISTFRETLDTMTELSSSADIYAHRIQNSRLLRIAAGEFDGMPHCQAAGPFSRPETGRQSYLRWTISLPDAFQDVE